ncbi:MAG: hypothetical protein AAF039_09815 [Bacteroidota bacterium]
MIESPANLKKYENFIDDPCFPYCLASYKDVNLYPLAEFWDNGKPYLYCGSESGPEGSFFWYYCLTQNKKFKVDMGKPNECKINFNSSIFSLYGEWPQEQLMGLQPYKFFKKRDASDHGHNHRAAILLVHEFNMEWGLFRFEKGQFRTVFLPEVYPELKLF